MQQISLEEVDTAFASAKNLNAALKNFLKREAQGNRNIEQFAKEFRAAAATGQVSSFLGRAFPKFEIYLFAVVRYAYAEEFTRIVQKVVDKYADEFNATYSVGDKGITVLDKLRFSAIAKEVDAIIETDLGAAGVPANAFMKRAAMQAIFDAAVLTEVLAVL